MNHFNFFILLCLITALASFINFKYLKLPKSIGLTIISVALSLLVFTAIRFMPEFFSPIYHQLNSVDFKNLVLNGMLGYLLFASAMHLNVMDLRKHFIAISSLASIGVLISTFIIGTIAWILAPYIIHAQVPYVVCLLVGAITSPTDPIAVFAVFKTNKNIPLDTKTRIAGESMFNDVAAIVLVAILVSIAFPGQNIQPTFGNIIILILREGAGGVLLGLLIGFIGDWFMRQTDDGQTLIILSLALVSAGFWLAQSLNVSGPLTMVMTGIIIGNSKRKLEQSKRATMTLSHFWEIIDELLNAFLFVLIGIEILEMKFSIALIIAGSIGFIVTIFARYISVFIPMLLIERKIDARFWKNNLIMTWGGLRGGISIALALSIPYGNNQYVSVTFSTIYLTVLLSILVQGSTFKLLLDKVYNKDSIQ
ncbi:MAG: CPA1 family monovalent cation:H+ antiporter [Francisellaceae bacterium]|jgi:CPA1 family monovalent cation:H+ antiporter